MMRSEGEFKKWEGLTPGIPSNSSTVFEWYGHVQLAENGSRLFTVRFLQMFCMFFGRICVGF